MFTLFQGNNALHIAICQNSTDCVKTLLDDTNIDARELNSQNESTIILACKNAVNIEILESLLINLRSFMSVDDVKKFMEIQDQSGLKAYDYCKIKKRVDLGVLLGEFVDKSKSVIEI